MENAHSFSVLNERLRPRFSANDQLHSSLTRLDRRVASLGRKSASSRPTVVPTEPEPKVSETEPVDDSEQESLVSDEDNCADLLNNPITEINLNDFRGVELADDNRSISSSEEKDQPGELASEGSGRSSQSVPLDGEGDSPFQRSCMNGTLPDLLNSGKTLSRRRTLGHVSETLKEVRREVELSRRRSIKLKAQVDKLQENRDGPAWSQHRERVTDDVLSILRLLRPLTESGSSLDPKTSHGENDLDTSLAQLQIVARELAISHTKQLKSGKGAEESAILQQALRDRDEAIEKKKAMETELLRSKTEMMLLNNQLLEAVQKRLELTLEVENWKEDVQRILQQQLLTQQQAEQAQRRPSRLGILRRTNKATLQRPTNFPLSQPVAPVTNPNQIFIPRAATLAAPTPDVPPPQRNWRDKLRRTKNAPDGGQTAAPQESGEKGGGDFQVISLD